MAKIYAFDFDLIENDEIEEALESAPYYPMDTNADFKKLLTRAIGIVHAIPSKLHRAPGERNQIVIYFGRTSADSYKGVKGRWKNKERGHRYGVILGLVPTKTIRDLEADTIKIFSTIEDNDGLCIKKLDNLSIGSNGPLPASKESVLYLTWSFTAAGEIGKLPSDEIDYIGEKIYDQLASDISSRSIKDILRLTREYSHTVPVTWFNGHPE